MLERIRANKDDEERRLLDGFLDRLSLEPKEVVKSESPDFFVRFADGADQFSVGCEIVRFHLDDARERANGLEHLHRWRRFAGRLREELIREGLVNAYGIRLDAVVASTGTRRT
ncbi:MAG: hypothetical protein KIT84_04285 [Labilithrix sp.]|nr:hypothetical protein [Labilithrix sp.]MCW5810205.1 hypothetical protein [Labilithrix sp.]